MALPVLDRLPLEGHETVLDAGCGSGRVTAALLERLPRGAVVATDAAPSMIGQARERFAAEPRVQVLDPVSLTELELEEPVDAAFSNAVFHWIKDHDALFARLHAALRPGAPLVAQCGGKGNIDGFRRLADEVAAEQPFAEHMASFARPWNYAAPAETEERLRARRLRRRRAAGSSPGRSTRPSRSSTQAPSASATTSRSCRSTCGEPFAEEVLRRSGEPLRLDYVRLNITARRASFLTFSGTATFAVGETSIEQWGLVHAQSKGPRSRGSVRARNRSVASGSRRRMGAGRHGHRPPGRPDVHQGASARRTSSSPTPAAPTSGRPRTAAAPVRPPTPTAAWRAASRSARPSRSPAPAGPARSSTAPGSRCRRTARATPTPAPTTTSRS